MESVNSGDILWLSGQIIEWTPNGAIWEVQGIYSTRELAVETCLDDYWFVGPIVLNQEIPADPTVWAGCEYPLNEHRGQR